MIRKLPVDHYPPWYLIAGGALAVAIFLFTMVLRMKTASGSKSKGPNLEASIAPKYEAKDLIRPTFLPTPTAGPEPTPTPVKIPIIMYHYVEYVADPKDTIRRSLDIPPNLFESHLKSLQQANFESYFVKDVPDIMTGKISYDPQKSVILSFDDGYEDFYTDVFPLLKKYHTRATLYVIYHFVGRPGFLTEEQVQELHDSGLVEIGDHTYDHIYLKTASETVAEKQIIESKKAFEDTYHFKIFTFAYPYGAMSQTAIEDVKKAGYTAAVSVIPGAMQSDENLFYLYRIRPGIFGYSAATSIENYNH